MVARVAKQAVIPGSHYDWRNLFARLPKLLLGMSVLGLCVMGWLKLNDPSLLPIQKVRAQGAFVNLTEAMLLSRAGTIQGSYFNIDVRSVQENIESLAWVDKAFVKRKWPDTVVISVIEQDAAARWQDKGLINKRGELFYPDKASFPAGLPILSGPAGTHKQVMGHYKRMSLMLAKEGLTVQRLEIDARRALTVYLDTGLKILLGRDEHYLRLDRFIRTYDKALVTEISQIQRVDMRYTNGFSVLRKQ